MQPKLPVINFNDGRLLPQTFEGGQITSSEINGLTLTACQLESTKTRSSTDDIDLRIGGATRPAGTPASTALADSDSFVFAGGDYKISKDLTAQYYYGSLEDFYKQHLRRPQRVGARPADRLRAAKRSTQGGAFLGVTPAYVAMPAATWMKTA